MERVKERYQHHESDSYLDSEWLKSSIKWIARFFGEIYVIIDGLDECTTREPLLLLLQKLKLKNGRILFSSRPKGDIMTAFEGRPSLAIDGKNSMDIATHVNWKLNHDPRLIRIKQSLKKEIEETLIQRSGGM